MAAIKFLSWLGPTSLFLQLREIDYCHNSYVQAGHNSGDIKIGCSENTDMIFFAQADSISGRNNQGWADGSGRN
jgi:hypothetical protein